MEVQHHGSSAEDSSTHEDELAQHSGCMCHRQQSCRDEAHKPRSAEMIPFQFYRLDMELQDLVFGYWFCFGSHFLAMHLISFGMGMITLYHCVNKVYIVILFYLSYS